MSNYKADLIIIGGGLSGCVAAIAASRLKLKVILIEKAPMLGGMATCAGVHSMLTFHSCKGHKIIGGIAQEIIDYLKKINGTYGHIRDTVGVAYSVTPVDTLKLSYILQIIMEELDIKYMLNTNFIDCKMDKERILEIYGVNQEGKFLAQSPLYIDASGGGNLAFCAGAIYERGRNKNYMPASLLFNMGNVDIKEVIRYMRENNNEFYHQTLFNSLDKSLAIGVSGYFKHWKNANLSVPRDRILFYETLNKNEVGINTTRIINFNPFDCKSVNRAYLEGRNQIFEILDFLKKDVPGFNKSRITNIFPYLGIREERRIIGEYILKGEDLSIGKRFKDEIALGGFPIDIHIPNGVGIETGQLGGRGFYGIPYRCLVPKGISNLFVIGKCFSGDFEAHASARVQAVCMAMGQAAGTAAYFVIKDKKEPQNVSIDLLREKIVDMDGILEPKNIKDNVKF